MKRYSLDEIDEILEDTGVNRFFDELSEIDKLNFGKKSDYEPTIETKIIRREDKIKPKNQTIIMPKKQFTHHEQHEGYNENSDYENYLKELDINKFKKDKSLKQQNNVKYITTAPEVENVKIDTSQLNQINNQSVQSTANQVDQIPKIKKTESSNNQYVSIKNNPTEANDEEKMEELIEATKKFFMQTQLFEERLEQIRQENKKMSKKQIDLTTIFIFLIIALIIILSIITFLILQKKI